MAAAFGLHHPDFLAAGGDRLWREAQASYCTDAVDDYNQTIGNVAYELERYSRCLSNSNGYDDCSSEFRRLRREQDDYESAVSRYIADCT